MHDSDKSAASASSRPGVGQRSKRKREVKAPEVRRQELLRAAAELFKEKGVNATAIGEITDRAQVAKGTFYIYFASKDELIAEMWKDYVAGFMQVADEANASSRSGPSPEKFLHLIERLTHHALDHAQLHLLVYGSADAAAIALCKQSDERILERLLQSIKENLIEQSANDEASQLQASLIFHGLDGALHRSIMKGDKIEREQFVRSIRAFAANALQLKS